MEQRDDSFKAAVEPYRTGIADIATEPALLPATEDAEHADGLDALLL
jgi:hypothetical protein